MQAYAHDSARMSTDFQLAYSDSIGLRFVLQTHPIQSALYVVSVR